MQDDDAIDAYKSKGGMQGGMPVYENPSFDPPAYGFDNEPVNSGKVNASKDDVVTEL